MLFERILRNFQQAGLKYAVIGGIAVNLHGYNRLTGDLDIIISFTEENIAKFISSAKELKLIPRLPVSLDDLANTDLCLSWVNDKNAKVFSVYNPQNPLEHVDLKLDFSEECQDYLANAIIMKAGDINIPVVTLEDLIALKKAAGRDRDMIDVKALERIKRLNG